MRRLTAALSSNGNQAVIRWRECFKNVERLANFQNGYWRWDDCKIEVPAKVALKIRSEQDAIGRTHPSSALCTSELRAGLSR
jgi:hypothetical protein